MKVQASLSGIELHHVGLRLAIRPDLGNCIAGLWLGDQPVLRSTEPQALSGPRQSACFAMLPYSNRIGYRRFEWQGRHYSTAPNFDDSPHSLHGVGWQRPWHLEDMETDHASFSYRHQPDEHWPFSFEASQGFMLTEGQLTMDIGLVNTDNRSQPAGVGWHPYFPLRGQSRLQIDVTSQWLADSNQLPQTRQLLDGIHSPVSALSLDHCFEGWQGRALIEDEVFRVGLRSSLDRLVVYTPSERGYFCVEPVSHVNNAIQAADPFAHGLRELQPGQTLHAKMTLEIEKS